MPDHWVSRPQEAATTTRQFWVSAALTVIAPGALFAVLGYRSPVEATATMACLAVPCTAGVVVGASSFALANLIKKWHAGLRRAASMVLALAIGFWAARFVMVLAIDVYFSIASRSPALRFALDHENQGETGWGIILFSFLITIIVSGLFGTGLGQCTRYE